MLHFAGFQGKPLDTGGELFKTASEKLHDAIGKSLRKGIYLPAIISQYLVMLNGTSNSIACGFMRRIDRSLHLSGMEAGR